MCALRAFTVLLYWRLISEKKNNFFCNSVHSFNTILCNWLKSRVFQNLDRLIKVVFFFGFPSSLHWWNQHYLKLSKHSGSGSWSLTRWRPLPARRWRASWATPRTSWPPWTWRRPPSASCTGRRRAAWRNCLLCPDDSYRNNWQVFTFSSFWVIYL